MMHATSNIDMNNYRTRTLNKKMQTKIKMNKKTNAFHVAQVETLLRLEHTHRQTDTHYWYQFIALLITI